METSRPHPPLCHPLSGPDTFVRKPKGKRAGPLGHAVLPLPLQTESESGQPAALYSLHLMFICFLAAPTLRVILMFPHQIELMSLRTSFLGQYGYLQRLMILKNTAMNTFLNADSPY